ncbi:MAG: hypothetical protein KGQ38_05280 [Actinomycetales bacterium]|nr:hypothetical protein [Actinomycetales bacterium]
MLFQKLWPLVIIYRKWIGSGLVALAVILAITAATSRDTTTVVIARKNIPAGAEIVASDLKVVATDYVWRDAIKNIESAVGLRAVTTISSGQPLGKSDLQAKQIFDPNNPRAVKVSLPKATGSSDLSIGSRVDVYAKPDSGKVRKIFSNALVLSAAKDGWSPLGGTDQGVALAVLPSQIRQLAELSESTTYTFVTLAQY